MTSDTIQTWSVRFKAPLEILPRYAQALEELDISLSWDASENADEVSAEAILIKINELCTAESIIETFDRVFGQQELPGVDLTPSLLPQKDWIKENRKQFPPLHVGSFFVYGPYFEDTPPADKIVLKVNASLAFGSGEHATTKGCLIALERLKAEYPDFKTGLDVGCGSGILCLAMAKLWDMNIIASDFDLNAVNITKENIDANKIQNINTLYSDGFENIPDDKVDLIAANILATPLIEFAPEMVGHLKEGGAIILSGLLDTQADDVLRAYHREGMTCHARFSIEGWTTLALLLDAE